MKRTGRVAVTLVMVLLLVLTIACAPTPGEITPPPTPTPEQVTPPGEITPEEVTPEEVTPPPTSEPAPAPSPIPEANFRLLISDEVNAIGDFESLMVTISSVGVHKAGEDGEWLEPTFTTTELDLVLLQEENAQEIWSGDLPDGQYTKVFVYVSDIYGVLLETGDSTEVKLPSEKLHINTHFSIPEDSPVSFVFDLSVVAAGSQQSGIKYILKPVVSQSGPNQEFTEVSPERERERERLRLELEGNIAPGETVTLLVTFEDEPVVGAEVVVNGEEIGTTTDDGTISFTIPEDADGLEIEVKLGELEGELEIELSQAE